MPETGSITLHGFQSTTSVGAYLAGATPDVDPVGSALATATSDAVGAVTFDGLPVAVRLFVSDGVNHRYARVSSSLEGTRQILTGPEGPPGAPGSPGVQGIQGVQGISGAQGPPGPSLTLRASVANQAALPAVGNAVGDGRITADTGHVWTWDGAAWNDGGLLQGPQGIQGIQGIQGPPGTSSGAGTNGPYNVIDDFGAKGDGLERTDAAITAGSTTLSCPGRAFVGGDIGKEVYVIGAGAAYNNRGAWAPATTYAVGDYFTYGLKADGITPMGHVSRFAFTSTTIFDIVKVDADHVSVAPLKATITGVSGTNAVLSVAASTTVSGATVFFGTNDSAAFQAMVTACSSTGRKGWVPRPPNGSFYIVQNVRVRSNVECEFANGVNIRPAIAFGAAEACFYFGASTAAGSRDTDMHFYSRGWCLFDARGTESKQGWVAIFVGGVNRFTIDGFRQQNNIDANLVNASPNAAGTTPLNGTIRRLRSEQSTFGFGPCQIEGGENLIIEHIWSDWNKPVNLEGHQSKITRNINIRNVVLEQRVPLDPQAAFESFAVGLIGHTNNPFQSIWIDGFAATGGGSGVKASQDSGGVMEDIHIANGKISGGGQALLHQWTANMRFKNFTVRNVWVDGCAVWSPFSNSYQGGFHCAEGMRFYDCIAENCYGSGFISTNLPTVTFGTFGSGRPGRGKAAFKNCYSINNGQAFVKAGPGTGNVDQILDSATLPARGGWDFQNGMQRIELEGCVAIDNPVDIDFLSLTQLDMTVSATDWIAGAGTTAGQPSPSAVNQHRYLTLTSDGTTGTMLVSTPIGTAGVAATPGVYYKAHCLGQQSSAVASGTARVVARLRFFDAAGVELTAAASTAANGTLGTTTTDGLTHEAVVVGLSPANTAFVAMEMEVNRSTGLFTAADVHWVIPLAFGKARVQAYGIRGYQPGQVYGVRVGQSQDAIIGPNCRLWGNQGTYRTSGGLPIQGRFSKASRLIYREQQPALSADILAIA